MPICYILGHYWHIVLCVVVTSMRTYNTHNTHTMVPSLEDRKRHTKWVLNALVRGCLLLHPNKQVAAHLIAPTHGLCAIGLVLWLILAPARGAIYVVCAVWWIIVLGLHIYFNGCILVRLERRLLDSTSWTGPWAPVLALVRLYDPAISSSAVFYGVAAAVTAVVVFRMMMAAADK